MYQIRNVFSELERNLISEGTKAGMEAVRKRGSKLGRPRKLDNKQIMWAKCELENNPKATKTFIAKTLNISAKTLNRALNLSEVA